MIYRFVVGWAADKDGLMAGRVVAGYSTVVVDATGPVDARLCAEQLVAACGREPTELEQLPA